MVITYFWIILVIILNFLKHLTLFHILASTTRQMEYLISNR